MGISFLAFDNLQKSLPSYCLTSAPLCPGVDSEECFPVRPGDEETVGGILARRQGLRILVLVLPLFDIVGTSMGARVRQTPVQIPLWPWPGSLTPLRLYKGGNNSVQAVDLWSCRERTLPTPCLVHRACPAHGPDRIIEWVTCGSFLGSMQPHCWPARFQHKASPLPLSVPYPWNPHSLAP